MSSWIKDIVKIVDAWNENEKQNYKKFVDKPKLDNEVSYEIFD